jgi:phosphonate transport system permease protein
MARRVFISYRRSDEREAAVRIGEGLAARFGRRHVFIDIDSLLPGARYDDSLLKALDNTDVLVAVIGPRWKEIMAERSASHERDYVLDEIAGALSRNIAIIPVRVGHQGALSTFPNEDELPPQIREFVRYQSQDVVYESFGRDMNSLADTITRLRKEAASRRRAAGAWISQRTLLWILAVVIAGLLAFSAGPSGLAKLVQPPSAGGMSYLVDKFTHPDFSPAPFIMQSFAVTLGVALWSAVLGGVIGLPLSFLCSGNLSPSWISWPVRRIAGLFAATNEVMLGALFIITFGIGPSAAVAALCFRSIGVLTKSFAEAIETADRPVEGLRRTSASVPQILYAILPEVIPRWVAGLATCFTSNVAGAMVLGALGGWGIGEVLMRLVTSFELDRLSAAVIIILACVIVLDLAARHIRELLGQP